MNDLSITKHTVDVALKSGASLIGFGPVSRFDGLPVDFRPARFMPEAKTVVTIAITMARGSLEVIEEGSYWISFNFDSSYYINYIEGPRSLRMIGRLLERHGYTALPLSNIVPGDVTYSMSDPGPAPDTGQVPYTLWAAGCGLGEIGRSGCFLTPEFGPRQRLCCLLTDAELEPSPIFKGSICDKCGECSIGCKAGALNGEADMEFQIEGRHFSIPRVDRTKCELERMGRDPKHTPFVNGKECYFELPPAFYKYLVKNARVADFCGGRGCITSCLDHLEKTGRIKCEFKRPLIQKERWTLED